MRRTTPTDVDEIASLRRQAGVCGLVAKLARAFLGGVCIALVCASAALAAGAPVVEEQWVTHVTDTSATLHAKINPEEASTTYRFEYASSEAALLNGEGKPVPTPPVEGAAGEGTTGVAVEVTVRELTAKASYWYRVVADGSGQTLGCRQGEACDSFTTQPASREEALPDHRMWQLVSPPNVDLSPSEPAGGIIQSSKDGHAITYLSLDPSEANPAGNANYSQVLSVRGQDGVWSSRDLATPHEESTAVAFSGQEYRFFSSDLSVGLVEPRGTGPSGENAQGAALLSPAASEKTVYLRALEPFSPGGQGVYDDSVESGDYLPLVTACPVIGQPCAPAVEAYADAPPGAKFGGPNQLSFKGATSDLRHVVLLSEVPLTEEKTPNGETVTGGGLYEWSGGKLQLISVLPDGAQAERPGFLGRTESYDVGGAISRDGSRVVWTEASGGAKNLYVRDMVTGETVQVDVPETGAKGGIGAAEFQYATEDGSRIFFTDTARLTTDATPGEPEKEPDLYECVLMEEEQDGKRVLRCKLHDLTVDDSGHADVLAWRSEGAIIGVGGDGSDAYFVANGVLTEAPNSVGEKAAPGSCRGITSPPNATCNLYVVHYDDSTGEWEPPVFVAALSSQDASDWAGTTEITGNLQEMTARVSPNGRYLAFMSAESLTGYDNRDVNSGERDSEVFLYDASANRLVCASCNPTGERPVGVFDSVNANDGTGLLVDTPGVLDEHWLSGVLPGWTAMENAAARYQPRYLSNEGRLFFDSPDALAPEATNGLMNVYEYEPPGAAGGSCERAGVSFDERTGGCVALVSSGSSTRESVFLDASESGDDVFFLSVAKLVEADKGSGLALYDAHVCNASVPCVPETAPPSACGTADACRAAPSPQPAVFGAPSSSTFAGPGNIAPSPAAAVKPTPKTVKCPKGKHLNHHKCEKTKHKKKTKAKKSAKGRK